METGQVEVCIKLDCSAKQELLQVEPSYTVDDLLNRLGDTDTFRDKSPDEMLLVRSDGRTHVPRGKGTLQSLGVIEAWQQKKEPVHVRLLRDPVRTWDHNCGVVDWCIGFDHQEKLDKVTEVSIRWRVEDMVAYKNHLLVPYNNEFKVRNVKKGQAHLEKKTWAKIGKALGIPNLKEKYSLWVLDGSSHCLLTYNGFGGVAGCGVDSRYFAIDEFGVCCCYVEVRPK